MVMATFDAAAQALPIREAGLKGIAMVDMLDGSPEEPLPKPQDATGAEVDICLCVPGAEPFATDAKGLAFILITQPRDDTVAFTPSEAASVKGHRVISLRIGLSGDALDLKAKPPMAELRFYDGDM